MKEVSPWQKLLEYPNTGGHFVQIYQTGAAALGRNVGLYFSIGLRRGDGALIITSPERRESFCRELDRLGIDVPYQLQSRRLVFYETRETLSRFMTNGQPEWNRFEKTAGAAMRSARPRGEKTGLRVYGDMVGFLWETRQFSAAIRLEQFWNKLLEQSNFCLYCAYGMDVFGKQSRSAGLDAIVCTHTHLIPAETDGGVESSLRSAMKEILGSRTETVRAGIGADHPRSWAIMPNAEAILVWLRKNFPGEAEQVIARAREHYGRAAANAPTA